MCFMAHRKRNSVHTKVAGAFGFEKKHKIKKTLKNRMATVTEYMAFLITMQECFELYSELSKTATIPT